MKLKNTLPINNFSMKDFSLLVRNKYEVLDSEQKQMFAEEYRRRKLPFGNESDNDLALSVLRDIALVFKNSIVPENIQKMDNETESKTYVGSTNSVANSNSKESYRPIILPIIIIVILLVSVFTKPDQVKMENKIVDKMMEHNPELVKIMKNLFFGKEMEEQYVQNFISNTLKKEGYNNVAFYESDWVILRKIEFRDVETNKSLIGSYGVFGQTFTTLNFSSQHISGNDFSNSNTSTKIEGNGKLIQQENQNYIRANNRKYIKIENPEANYSDAGNEIINEVKSTPILKGRNHSGNVEKIKKLEEDSIKIN